MKSPMPAQSKVAYCESRHGPWGVRWPCSTASVTDRIGHGKKGSSKCWSIWKSSYLKNLLVHVQNLNQKKSQRVNAPRRMKKKKKMMMFEWNFTMVTWFSLENIHACIHYSTWSPPSFLAKKTQVLKLQLFTQSKMVQLLQLLRRRGISFS